MQMDTAGEPFSTPGKPLWKRPVLWVGLAGALILLLACAFAGYSLLTKTIDFPWESGTEQGDAVIDQAAATATAVLPIDLGIDFPDDTLPIEVPGLGIELPRLTDEEEVEIGKEAAAEFESQYAISSDPALVDRVTRIGNSLVPYQPRQEIHYTFKVIDTAEINAFALPGGFIYISRGMLDFVESDDELAGVIGHEIAHVALRHSARQIETIAAGQMALDTILSANEELETIYQDQAVQIATEMVSMVALSGWGRMNELDADEYGTVFMAHAGYDPQAVLDLMHRLDSQSQEGSGEPMADLLATHPPFSERIARVEYAIETHGLS
jgi:predicted Zn-dependent protease